MPDIARNRYATYRYNLLDKWECGVALDLHRLALGLRGVLAELEQLVAARRGVIQPQ